MKSSPNNKDVNKQKPKQPRETLEERVHRHLNDINSKITDDDIRNVTTELEIRSQGPAPIQSVNTQESEKRNKPRAKQKNKTGRATNR